MAAFRCTTTTPPIALRQRGAEGSSPRDLSLGRTGRDNDSNARFEKEGQSFLRAARIFGLSQPKRLDGEGVLWFQNEVGARPHERIEPVGAPRADIAADPDLDRFGNSMARREAGPRKACSTTARTSWKAFPEREPPRESLTLGRPEACSTGGGSRCASAARP
jgi:hypothetical protein